MTMITINLQRKRFSDEPNQDIVTRLVVEVSKLDTHVLVVQFCGK